MLIRTLGFKKPKKAGFHRMYWNMDEKKEQIDPLEVSQKAKENAVVNLFYQELTSLFSQMVT